MCNEMSSVRARKEICEKLKMPSDCVRYAFSRLCDEWKETNRAKISEESLLEMTIAAACACCVGYRQGPFYQPNA